MAKYETQYRCRICGQIIRYGEADEVPRSMLPDLIGKFINNQRYIGSSYLYKAHMHIPHLCENGSGGLAEFIGFRRVG